MKSTQGRLLSATTSKKNCVAGEFFLKHKTARSTTLHFSDRVQHAIRPECKGKATSPIRSTKDAEVSAIRSTKDAEVSAIRSTKDAETSRITFKNIADKVSYYEEESFCDDALQIVENEEPESEQLLPQETPKTTIHNV
ncbi:hypothetical protein L596_021225 [Steinernema carpocapsae]|uniref:Uncharacterized protein n=1 Tax=Steinernema carpocapsae TaxID=34508 RepID=A0A4U5MVZ0_STECR|nr:hypothetical protein L596_021225 [Steinernema carpocapsae]